MQVLKASYFIFHHQHFVHIRSIYEERRCCFYLALSQWPGDSMQEFFPEVSLPTQLNHLNQNCFANQKLQLFSKAMSPKTNSVHYITMVPLIDSMRWVFPWGVFPPDSLIEQRKCQITIIETVLSARNCNYSEKQWNPKPFFFVHFKLTLTTSSLKTNEGGHPKIKCHDRFGNLLMRPLTGDAPTTSEWSTNSLPTKVWLILEVL